MYFYGKGAPQDYAEAARWCRKAAEQGDALAEFVFGSMYYNGDGVPQDYTEAARWYRKAAEQGNPKGQRDLGSVYFYGKGMPQDYTEAAHWYRKAAEQGDPSAQSDLGSMYRDGNGVQQDYSEAIRWYRKAASQGNAEAEYNLGYMNYYGHGLPQDHATAMRWFREAADHGHPDAQHLLRSIESKPSTATRIRYIVVIVAFVGGLLFSVAPLWPGRSFRNSRHATALGLIALAYGGLNLYGLTHGDVRYSAYRNFFFLAQELLIGMAIIVAIIMIAAKQKKTEAK
jgi:TPR repeat protein